MPFGCRSVCRPVVWLTLCAMLTGQAGLAPAYAQTNAAATSGTSSPPPAGLPAEPLPHRHPRHQRVRRPPDPPLAPPR